MVELGCSATVSWLNGGFFPDASSAIPAGTEGATHAAGALTTLNAGPDCNATMFGVALSKQGQLDGTHLLLGRLVAGHDVLDAIGRVKRDQRSGAPFVKILVAACGIFEVAPAAPLARALPGGTRVRRARRGRDEDEDADDAAPSDFTTAVGGFVSPSLATPAPSNNTTGGAALKKRRAEVAAVGGDLASVAVTDTGVVTAATDADFMANAAALRAAAFAAEVADLRQDHAWKANRRMVKARRNGRA